MGRSRGVPGVVQVGGIPGGVLPSGAVGIARAQPMARSALHRVPRALQTLSQGPPHTLAPAPAPTSRIDLKIDLKNLKVSILMTRD